MNCKERITKELNDRIKDLETLFSLYKYGEDASDPDLGRFEEYGLCFDYVEQNPPETPQAYFRYQLSWGGPADEFRFFVNPDLTPYSIEYWFYDWGDSAKIELTGKRWKLLEDIFEHFKGLGLVEITD